MIASKQGIIFNIQYFSVHDGPGIRTVIFLKGCPLGCLWCANPESQKSQIEIAWQESKCICCGQCSKVCRQNAIRMEEGIVVDQTQCIRCKACTDCCPSEAIYSIGEVRNVEELLDEVSKDEVFYSNSKGGITLSGGEPLMQSEFAIELLKRAKARYLNTAIETTGYVRWEVLREAAQYLDHIFYDIKCMNDEKHHRYTNVSNNLIHQNFHKLCNEFKELPIVVRTPVIPGVNDTKEEIEWILDLIEPYPNVTYELLPYHGFGKDKYKNLGREYLLTDAKLDGDIMDKLRRLVEKRGKES